jgi:outer membrane protein
MPIQAQNLLEVYELANQQDPILQSAKQQQLATLEATPQARAQFLPTVQASANHSGIHNATANNTGTQNSIMNGGYSQNTCALTVSQPIFYYQQWVQFDKASKEVKAAYASYAAAEQDLIVRTVNTYFNVLKAIDTLKFKQAQRIAFEKFLDQTEQRYRVGLIAITDVQIAKAQRDSAYAEEIAAQNSVENQKEQLREITGQPIDHFTALKKNIPLTSPKPTALEAWVHLALKQNFSLQALRYQNQAGRADIQLTKAGHLPTLNVNGVTTRTSNTPLAPRNTNSTIGLQVSVPLFSGGLVNSKTKQAVHLYEKNKSDFERLYKKIESQTRQNYRNVITQISQTQALQQAIVSNRSALKATEASFNVGSRTIVDVLNAQSNLIKAEQDYANARYDYMIQSVQLKQAAGTLSPLDIIEINALLQ